MAWKSGLKVLLLPVGISCTLQTILLSDLVGCDTPLQIIMVFGALFFKFEASQTATIVSSGRPHPTQHVKIQNKVRQTAITIFSGQAHPTGWAALPSEKNHTVFSRAEKPSEDVNSHLFLMNKKGLNLRIF
jgi:hypothetical protein